MPCQTRKTRESGAQAKAARRREIVSRLSPGMVVEGRVRRIEPYGAFVDLGGADALMRLGDLAWRAPIQVGDFLAEGETLSLMLLTVDREAMLATVGLKQMDPRLWENGRYCPDRAALLEREIEADREAFFDSLSAGQIVDGRVKRIEHYGVFISLGAADGLCMKTDLSWQDASTFRQSLKVGQPIRARVLNIDKDKRHISLGIKQLTDNPWPEIEKSHPPGSIRTGVVAWHAPAGIHVRLDSEIEGFVHVSEIEWRRRENPFASWPPGKQVEVKVMEIRRTENKARLALSIKRCAENPWEACTLAHAPGAVLECPILSRDALGIFLELDDGMRGLARPEDVPAEILGLGSLELEGRRARAELIEIDTEAGKARLRLLGLL